MADIDIKEIADARYMGLMCPPASPEAKAIIQRNVSRLIALPLRGRFRVVSK